MCRNLIKLLHLLYTLNRIEVTVSMATTSSNGMQAESQIALPAGENGTCDPTAYYQDGFITMGNRREPRCMYCDPECSGGCIGPSASDCVSCKNLQFYSYCLTECPFGYKAEDPNQDNHCYMLVNKFYFLNFVFQNRFHHLWLRCPVHGMIIPWLS